MTYAVSSALQAAVYQQLADATGLTEMVDDAIYDALPAGVLPPLYVVLGPETVRDASDMTGGGAVHEFTISVVTDGAGFATAKEAAAIVCDVLVDAPLSLSRGALVFLNFYKAKAARVGTGDIRQINLTFRARVADDT